MTKRRTRARRKHNTGMTKLLVHTPGILLLPPEVVYLILSSCSNPTLVALAQTCTKFNTIALHAFFKRGKFADPAAGTLTSWGAPTEMLDATRTALFVTRLGSVHWQFEPVCKCQTFLFTARVDPSCPFRPSEAGTESGINTANTVSRTGPLRQTFDEVANLQAIFSRLPEVGYVYLDLMLVDQSLNSSLLTHPIIGLGKVDRDLWKRTFIGLLDKILDNGCHHLEVSNGKELKRLYSTQNSRALASPTTAKRTFLKLQNLSVHSDMLLMPPFYNWTLSLLTSPACADTLTHLSFQPQITPIPSPLLVSLDLPNLVEFKVQALYTTLSNPAERVLAKFEDIAAFLGTHGSQLRTVSLYGVGLPPLMSVTTTVRAFDRRKPILPSLHSITAHPAYIVWLLDLAVRSQSKTTLGNLTTINIKSENYQLGPHFDYASFDGALKAMVSWQNSQRGERKRHGTRSRIKNKNFTEAKTIGLTLDFASQLGDVREWFANHLLSLPGHGLNLGTNLHLPEPSILTQLTCISTLTISMSFPAVLSEETANILPDWLALISNADAPLSSSGSSSRRIKNPGIQTGTPSKLQTVELTHTGQFPGDKDQFIKRVAEKCSSLKWIQVGLGWNDPRIDLDEVRDGTGQEDE